LTGRIAKSYCPDFNVRAFLFGLNLAKGEISAAEALPLAAEAHIFKHRAVRHGPRARDEHIQFREHLGTVHVHPVPFPHAAPVGFAELLKFPHRVLDREGAQKRYFILCGVRVRSVGLSHIRQ